MKIVPWAAIKREENFADGKEIECIKHLSRNVKEFYFDEDERKVPGRKLFVVDELIEIYRLSLHFP